MLHETKVRGYELQIKKANKDNILLYMNNVAKSFLLAQL